MHYKLIINIIIICLLFWGCFSELWADIVMFMDNSGSIQEHKHDLYQQMNEIFMMAEDVNKSIRIIPIGENHFQVADNFEKAKQIFSFDNSHTYVAEAFKNAEKKGYVQSGDTVIIISDMEPDLTNTAGNWKFLSCDYRNMLDWYNILIQWMKNNITIHLLLVNVDDISQFKPEALKKDNIIDELFNNIKGSEQLESLIEKFTSLSVNNYQGQSYYKAQPYNQKLIERMIKSLQTVLFNPPSFKKHPPLIYLYPLNNTGHIMSIVESIIDPNIIKNFHIKIEIDPNIISLSRPEQQYFKSYLKQNAPSTLSTNPIRKAKYLIVNVASNSSYDHMAHYHFKIVRGSYNKRMNVLLTNKTINHQGDIQIMTIPQRQQYNIEYKGNSDLLYKILNILNKLVPYQIQDFPLGEKKIMITLKTEYLKYFLGNRLYAKPVNASEIMLDNTQKDIKKLSTTISFQNKTEGSCTLWVQRQVDLEIGLSILLFKDEINPAEILIPIRTVKASMLNRRASIIVLTDKKDIPLNIVSQIKIVPNPQATKATIQIIPYDYSEYKIIDQFDIKSEEQKRILLPGSYRYNVLYNSLDNSYLNVWFVPFHVDIDNPDMNNSFPAQQTNTIFAYCIEDQFKDYHSAILCFDEFIKDIRISLDPNAPIPKLGPNELNGVFKMHLLGSPFFFLRLFDYTSINIDRLKDIELKEMWRRIYHRLYIEGYELEVNPGIIGPALKKLLFYEKSKIITKSWVYLKLMLAQYSKQVHNEFLTSDERNIYNKYILQRILYEKLNLKRDFVMQLKL